MNNAPSNFDPTLPIRILGQVSTTLNATLEGKKKWAQWKRENPEPVICCTCLNPTCCNVCCCGALNRPLRTQLYFSYWMCCCCLWSSQCSSCVMTHDGFVQAMSKWANSAILLAQNLEGAILGTSVIERTQQEARTMAISGVEACLVTSPLSTVAVADSSLAPPAEQANLKLPRGNENI